MKKVSCLLFILVQVGLFFSAKGQINVSELALKNLDNQPISLSLQSAEKATVLFFLSSDCPLCENYSRTINELRKKFSEREVTFIGVFSGKYVVKKDVKRYLEEFNPSVNVVLDPEYELSKKLGATITPEVFAFNPKGDLFYQGKIDNWLASLGKYRTNITRHYLNDALTAELAGKEVPVKRTEAVGCFIE